MEVLFELSTDILKKGKSIRFHATGWSMSPFIRDGDFITVSPVKSSFLKIGDIALYSTAENKIIVHRIIKKHKNNGRTTLWIKGDAAFGSPEKVDAQSVLGKVTAIERSGRKRTIETKPYQVIGIFIAAISPFNQWVYPFGSLIKRNSRQLLRAIVKKL